MIVLIRGYFNNAVSKLYRSIFSTEYPLFKLVSFLVLSSYLIIHTDATSGVVFTVSAQEHRLKGSVIKNTTASSAVHCMRKCLYEGRQCKSINHRKISYSKSECQLNNKTAACNTLNLIAHKEFDYFERNVEGQNAFCLALHRESKQLPSAFLAGKSCADLYKKSATKDGIYTIDPDGQGEFKVRCDMTTSGGGWTVFQRRADGTCDFYRGWNDYKNGFGDLDGEFWLGLDKINRLSNSGDDVLRVDLEDFENETSYAYYSTFAVANETDKYRLTVGGYEGDASDSLKRQNGMMFSTKDADNDDSREHCAVRYKGAWWYEHCHDSNLNGRYLHGKHTSYSNGVNWDNWKGEHYSLKKTEMKIRPRSF